MTFAMIVQLVGAATIAVGIVKGFDALDNPQKAKKDRASAANRHAVGGYHQR